MALQLGQGARRPAHVPAHGGPPRNISSATNSVRLGHPQGPRTSTKREGSRARDTQRKRDRRDRRNELKVPRSLSPTDSLRRLGSFADHLTSGHGDEEHSSTTYSDTDDPSPRLQQGCTLQERITRDSAFSGDDESVQPLSLLDGHQGQAEYTGTDTRDDPDMDVNDFAELFGPEPPPPRPLQQPISTKPIQYGSSYHLPFNRYLHPPNPALPATRREPIRMINSWMSYKPDIDGPTPGHATQPPSSPPAKAPEAKKHPVNPYKGNDPVKRRVQNKLLRYILAGKPLPKPRKKADRMVLKCAGRQEFRF